MSDCRVPMQVYENPAEQGGWIPISESEPEVGSFVQVKVRYKNNREGITNGLFIGLHWILPKDIQSVIAWKPLPESHAGDGHE